ncbi:hypothetical protein PENARI_c050G08103 [Penicillium arizonense]|uniref:Uncharacterized protein n=1 Tax=Penicillium arizonense TaxID=1835702 RepID=A0A1F5L2P1_PENAI|nr:hypothetical protein PENARI_c050G08103 [Penicillium arizonense]OGE47316.1 hypothetical protein PENARI_c050G08103 [Penicillium arizonense]
MANDSKPSRSAGRGATETKSRTSRSRAGSPCSVRSTVSTSKADRNPQNPVAKLRKDLGHSITKTARKKDYEATHRHCLDVMDQIQEEFELALGKMDDERAHGSQLVQRLHVEKAQETSNLQQAITAKDKALEENQRLERELCQIKQQQESFDATMQDQVSWNDIQPVLHQTHCELVSATTRLWNTIDALQNRRPASCLPGSEVIHGTWPDQDGPLGNLGQNALPGFSSSSNDPLVTQQVPAPTNQYESLM